CQHYKSYPFTF
nr:immunoglobulin light chain junction region [Macaca mulatta]